MPDIPVGDFVEIKAGDGKKYYLAHLGAVYSCTCQEWKQQESPNAKRTCTHLRQYLGAQEEAKRIYPYPVGKAEPAQGPFVARPDTHVDEDDLGEESVKEESCDIFDDVPVEEILDEANIDDFTWSLIVPYESSISSALQKARQHEFDTHFSKWSSIEEATQEATGTILDIKYVETNPPPGIASASPLPASVLMSVFGTKQPTPQMIGDKTLLSISRLLWRKWNVVNEPVQAFYVVLYQNNRPSEVFFAGWLDPGK